MEKFGKRYVAIIAAATSVSPIGICVNNNNRIITAHSTRCNHENLHAPAVEFLYVFVIPCHYTLRNPIHTPIPSLSYVCACVIVGCKNIYMIFVRYFHPNTEASPPPRVENRNNIFVFFCSKILFLERNK